MPFITFVEASGDTKTVEVRDGFSVMEGALQNGIEGIAAECGGACACATCHVVVADEWADRVTPIQEQENDMLDFVDDRRPTSRLSCQLRITPDVDGLIVAVPPEGN